MVGCDYMEVIVLNARGGSAFELACFIIFCFFFLLYYLLEKFLDALYHKSVKSEVAFTNRRININLIKHFVYDTLIDLPNSKFVLMINDKTKIISPAVYTKRKDKISIINRGTEYILFEHIEFSDDAEYDYALIRTCTLKNKKTGEQVLFVAVPNRETDILAYSDSAHKADKTVTFGKFRIFCFVETDNNLYTDLIVDSEKIHLEKSKRKGMYFIGLDEVTKEK